MKKLSPKDKTIHDQFSRYGRNAKEWMNKCVLLLPQIEKNQIWKKKGFLSIYEYAAKIAGMSRNKVNEALRILKKAENLPAMREVIKNKGILAVRPVVNIANKETDKFWAEKACKMSKNTLETFVRDFKKEQEEKSQEHFENQKIMKNNQKEIVDNFQLVGRPRTGSPTSNGLNKPNFFRENLEIFDEKDSNQNNKNNDKNSKLRIQVSMKLNREIVDQLKKIKMEGDWNEVMKKLLKYSQKKLKAEQKRQEAMEKQFQKELEEEKPIAIKSNNHTVTTAVKKYIKKRSKGLCEHPNCNKPGKHIHHIEPFALKREHDPDKLIYLCEEHHQIIHLGYIDDSEIKPEYNNITSASSNVSFFSNDIVPVVKQLRGKSYDTWKQIKNLPTYDLKNIINERIAEFRQNNNSQQFIT